MSSAFWGGHSINIQGQQMSFQTRDNGALDVNICEICIMCRIIIKYVTPLPHCEMLLCVIKCHIRQLQW